MLKITKYTAVLFLLIAVVITAIAVVRNPSRNGNAESAQSSSNQHTTSNPTKLSEAITTSPSGESTSIETGNETVKGYAKVPASEIEKISVNTLKYHFKSGQPDREGPDVLNNYAITFPDTWQVYTATNDKNRDDYGTNLLLKKGEDSIVISQQLFESSMCYFDKKYLSDVGVGVYCQFVQNTQNTDFNLKVFMNENMPLSNGSVTYGVCDQDAYARSIASYAQPTQSDKEACSPWSKFGEITFTTNKENTENYKEFLSIIQSLEVI